MPAQFSVQACPFFSADCQPLCRWERGEEGGKIREGVWGAIGEGPINLIVSGYYIEVSLFYNAPAGYALPLARILENIPANPAAVWCLAQRKPGGQSNSTHLFTKGGKMRKALVLLVLFGLLLGLHTPLWAEDGAKININTATVEELTQLKNVGPKTAERIVAYRKAHGPFKTAGDLVYVKGIGAKIVERNQNRITVE